jgi:hypothetical protein
MSKEIQRIEGPTDDVLLARIEGVYAAAAEALGDIVARLKNGEAVPPKEVVAEALNHRVAFERVMQERDKIGKLRTDIAGAVGRRTLDLDAARSEIGRRLACLRNGRPG